MNSGVKLKHYKKHLALLNGVVQGSEVALYISTFRV